ncbi:hypothetical protein JXA27_06690 [Aerococcaceae bacterium zg-B36]|uniref:hypothetical protein n=1 Tax=Aerococcaceae bacterium zg-252 TaxID=2796928 RepID=UPI001BD893A4|nr:hypothetical protein [Aerococcaceae bacterium zg-B36]
MSELLTELKSGASNFKIVGQVRLSNEGLASPKQNDAGTWLGVNTNFSIDTGNGNVVGVTINGGRSLTKNELYSPSKEKGKTLKIPIANRNDPKILEQIPDFRFFRANLVKGENGIKVIDTIDYLDYLKANLKNDMDVVVTGNAEYSEYTTKEGDVVVSRRYIVKNIYLNEITTDAETGEEKLRHPLGAVLRQTYLFDDTSLPKDYQKQLETEGKVEVSAYVPVYMSKIKAPSGAMIDHGKNVPLLQKIVFKGDESRVPLVERFFKVKRDKLSVRTFNMLIQEGFIDDTPQEVELSDWMKELIRDGVATEEDFKTQPQIRSTRAREVVYGSYSISRDEEGNIVEDGENIYDISAFYNARPNFENEENKPLQFEISSPEEIVKDSESDLDAFFNL